MYCNSIFTNTCSKEHFIAVSDFPRFQQVIPYLLLRKRTCSFGYFIADVVCFCAFEGINRELGKLLVAGACVFA